jgi:hypothetical protein
MAAGYYGFVAVKTVIGLVEVVDFPAWGVMGVKAKVDTGARTSALHVDNLEHVGEDRVRFEVISKRKDLSQWKRISAHVLRWSHVKSSTGERTERCFVRTAIRLGAIEKEIELSLTSRDRMRFRMLLGRRALGRDFLVDVSRRYMLSRPLKIKQ